MTTSLKAIQKAIIDKLKSDNILLNMVTNIFDEVKENAIPPYIAVEEVTETTFNTFDRTGRDATITIHILSEYRGFKEGFEILNRVSQLLDYKELDLEGWSLVYIRYDSSNAFKESEGLYRHIVADFNVITQED